MGGGGGGGEHAPSAEFGETNNRYILRAKSKSKTGSRSFKMMNVAVYMLH